jgi:Cu-Zn family superoxide dismutase
MRSSTFTLSAAAATLTLVGCTSASGPIPAISTGEYAQVAPAPREGAKAAAELRPTTGNTASGTVRFVQQGDAVIVTAKVTGLKPGQEHGFHIHEKGDCSGGDGLAAGRHFNPTGKLHGPQHADHHAGDFPALKADADGAAETIFRAVGLTIGTDITDILGKALIVHARPDDYKTQPTGNAGARIACAVIGKG